ncbi:MAG: hypothetical protein K6357_01265 [Elusimicrobiota bacterium]
MIKRFAFLFFLIFSKNLLFSTDFQYGANFLKIPIPALTSGISEAYTSMVGPDSILYNPAGLGLLTYSALSATHNKYFEGINQEYISAVINTKYGNLGAVYSVMTSGDITAYDSNENIIGKTSTAHKFYGIAYSKGFPYFDYARRKIDPMLITPSMTKLKPVKVYIPKVYRFSFGFLAKKIEERLDNETSSTLVFDGGALLVLPGHFQIGASVQNIGGSQKFFSQIQKIPQVYRVGVAKDFSTIKGIMNFIFIVDYVYDEASGGYFNFGFEDDISKTFQIRVGYTTIEREGSSLSLGIGMTFDSLLTKESFLKGFRMDYAYLNYGIFGVTHRIGFQIVW